MGHCDSSGPASGHGKIFRARSGANFAFARGEETFTVKNSPSPVMPGRTAPRGAAAWLLLFGVRAYRIFLSPFFGGACKFYPSCSRYADQAIERWGARRGAWLALRRLLRCRPFSPGGYDPVPEKREGRPPAREGMEAAH